MKNIQFTELEKNTLKYLIEDGYAEDDMDCNFISYSDGIGKKERGALASLVKKGVVTVDDDMVDLTKDWTKTELFEMLGIAC